MKTPIPPFSAQKVGERLRAVRIARGHRNQTDFYTGLAIKPGLGSAYEHGHNVPGLARLRELAHNLRCPIEYLIDGDDDRMTLELKRALEEIGAKDD